jgi:hypothetical protein
MWAKIKARFKEPSTYAGLAALAVFFGVPEPVANAALVVVNTVGSLAGASGVTVAGIGQAVVAVCGAVAVLAPEKR